MRHITGSNNEVTKELAKGDRVKVISVFWDGTPTGTITAGPYTRCLGQYKKVIYVVTFDAPACEAHYEDGDPRYSASEVFADHLEELSEPEPVD